MTELLLFWTVTLLNCYFTELLLYWTVTLLNCDWTVTWLSCYFSELLLYWTATLLNCYFTGFFAVVNLRNSEVSQPKLPLIRNTRTQGAQLSRTLRRRNASLGELKSPAKRNVRNPWKFGFISWLTRARISTPAPWSLRYCSSLWQCEGQNAMKKRIEYFEALTTVLWYWGPGTLTQFREFHLDRRPEASAKSLGIVKEVEKSRIPVRSAENSLGAGVWMQNAGLV